MRTGTLLFWISEVTFTWGARQYPAYDPFVDSVREEVIQNVKRLRHHPCVVIFGWCHLDRRPITFAHIIPSWK
jgi:hypothetical protein